MKNLPKSLMPFTRQWVMSWISIIMGSVFLSTGYVLFVNPYNIIPGGVYGIGIILHSFFPSVEVGTFGLILDIPLLLIALKIFGTGVGARTIVAAISTPILMNILTYIIGDNPEIMLNGTINLQDDMLLAALFGGVISGIGLGFIFKSNATSGGTDIIAMALTKYTHLHLSSSIIIIESFIVLAGLIVFGDWKLPLYSIIMIFTYVQVINYITDGPSNDKLMFIISKEHKKIKQYIISDLDRGGTYIKSSGMYTNENKDMMFVVVGRSEINLIKSIIHEVDKDAFMIVVNAHETFGDGFKSFPKINS